MGNIRLQMHSYATQNVCETWKLSTIQRSSHFANVQFSNCLLPFWQNIKCAHVRHLKNEFIRPIINPIIITARRSYFKSKKKSAWRKSNRGTTSWDIAILWNLRTLLCGTKTMEQPFQGVIANPPGISTARVIILPNHYMIAESRAEWHQCYHCYQCYLMFKHTTVLTETLEHQVESLSI